MLSGNWGGCSPAAHYRSSRDHGGWHFGQPRKPDSWRPDGTRLEAGVLSLQWPRCFLFPSPFHPSWSAVWALHHNQASFCSSLLDWKCHVPVQSSWTLLSWTQLPVFSFYIQMPNYLLTLNKNREHDALKKKTTKTKQETYQHMKLCCKHQGWGSQCHFLFYLPEGTFVPLYFEECSPLVVVLSSLVTVNWISLMAANLNSVRQEILYPRSFPAIFRFLKPSCRMVGLVGGNCP